MSERKRRYGYGFHPDFKAWVFMDTKDHAFIEIEGRITWDTKEDLLNAIRSKYPNLTELT